MKLIKAIANGLRKTKLYIPARTAYWIINPRLRRMRIEEKRNLSKIGPNIIDSLKTPLYKSDGGNKTVLIMGMSSVRYILQETIVRKSFELAGYRCKVIAPQDAIVINTYRKLGNQDIIIWDHYKKDLPKDGARILAGCITLEALVNLSMNGVRFGKYAVSSLMRKIRSGSFDLTDSKIKIELADALNKSLQCAEIASLLVKKIKPSALVLVDRGYTPSGELFDICIESNIPVFTWNAGHKYDTIMLKRYEKSNYDVHPSSLSHDTWCRINAMQWGEIERKRVLKELEYGYSSGEWYGEVGTQINKTVVTKTDLIKRLNLNPNLKIIIIFPHILWDATFFWGKDLFQNYEEWFVETVKGACKNKNVNWIIKIHPANIVKNKREEIESEFSELNAIRDSVGSLPPHVKILDAQTEMSTLSLFSVADACVTVRGTVGLEAACFGVPVLTAGTGRYDKLGFTNDSETRDEYLGKIANIQNLEKLDMHQVDLALKYAYGTLLLRPLLLKMYKMSYLKNETADLQIDFTINDKNEVKNMEDVRKFADWIESGKEDYVDWFV